jgi:nitric oxide synthase oxygenase domain/subunit
MVTFVGLAPDSTLRFGADTTLNGTWRPEFLMFKDLAFVEAAMAYFFSYRQQAGVSLQDVMD